jgi:hypothetical protein
MGINEPGSLTTSQVLPQEIMNVPEGPPRDLTAFMYYNAPYPNVNVAIVGMLAFFAAIFGRSCNVSGTGINIWIAIIGQTAIGKEAAQDGISKIISACIGGCPGIAEFFGPSKWASPEAMHKRIAKTPSVLGFMGELGLKVKMWCAPNASSVFAGLIAFMLDVYGKSGRGSILHGQENSDKDKNTAATVSPALSLLGDTTPSTWYVALEEKLIANGFVSRWITVDAGDKRGKRNKAPITVPSDKLITVIKNAAAFSLRAQASNQVVDVKLDDEAERLSDELEQSITAIINSTNAEVTRHLYSRVPLNVLKAAAICAAARDFAKCVHPTINAADFMWAKRLVIDGAKATLDKFESGEVGEEAGNQAKQHAHIYRIAGRFITTADHGDAKLNKMVAAGTFPKSYLQSRINTLAAFKPDARRNLDSALKSLCEADELREMPREQTLRLFDTNARCYTINNPAPFIKGR